MNTVLLLFILSVVLDIKSNAMLDRFKSDNEAGWGSFIAVLGTAALSLTAFAAGIVKWCLL
jgi:hypothetical protein|nr:MAG TPA: hypothetical protein [Caudoviricetes sp.]